MTGPNSVVVIDGVHRVWQWIGFTMPHDHLTATPLEAGQIRVVRVVDELECLATELLVEGILDVSVESEGPKVIVKIFEHRILEERRVLRIWHVPDRLSLIEFARLRHPWIDLFARGQVHRRPTIHTLEGFDLRRGETCRVVGTGAEQTLGVEIATPRVIDLAVHKTVQLVAGRYHGLEDYRQLADRDGVRAGGILMIALPGPDVPRAQLEHPEDR